MGSDNAAVSAGHSGSETATGGGGLLTSPTFFVAGGSLLLGSGHRISRSKTAAGGHHKSPCDNEQASPGGDVQASLGVGELASPGNAGFADPGGAGQSDGRSGSCARFWAGSSSLTVMLGGSSSFTVIRNNTSCISSATFPLSDSGSGYALGACQGGGTASLPKLPGLP
ncbi:UNVERIFIED_CONTAM: hypothetical protein FKN15_015808 [Acipenser sinensis]